MERNCNKCIHHTSGNCDSWNCKMQTVEDAKKEAVNEYVKSVVEELETIKDGYDHSCIDNTYQRGVQDGAKWMKNKAIEIVKQGGVYDDDVCEWKLTDTRKVMPYKTSCGNEDLYDNSWKYCPHCSKKIKIVGD